MTRKAAQSYPRGWNEKKILAVIDHYDRQSAEEGAVEIETAPAATGETWMRVPIELIGAITRLIEDHAKKPAASATRNHKTKSRPK
jgi:hypothetical protein